MFRHPVASFLSVSVSVVLSSSTEDPFALKIQKRRDPPTENDKTIEQILLRRMTKPQGLTETEF